LIYCIKIAETIKPWIFTGGTDSGIHRLIGDVLQGHKYNETVLLGITAWNIVKGRQSLKTFNDPEAIKYPPVHPADEKSNVKADEIYLNKDHSHFLLVDFPEKGAFQETLFRAKLEQKLINQDQGFGKIIFPITNPIENFVNLRLQINELFLHKDMD